MEFTEAESNLNDLVSEYQQYQGKKDPFLSPTLSWILPSYNYLTIPSFSPSLYADASAEEAEEYEDEDGDF